MSYQPPPPPEEQPYNPQGGHAWGTPPPPPPPQYGTQQYGAPRFTNGPVRQAYGYNNSTATAAMWFGIAGLLCGPVAFIALILGFSGLSKSKTLGGVGRGKSIFAIVIGIIWLISMILLVSLGDFGSTPTTRY